MSIPLCSRSFCPTASDLRGGGNLTSLQERHYSSVPGKRTAGHITPVLEAPPKQSTELNIVQLQRADGSWELKPELAQALSCKLPAIEAAKPKDASNPQWATVLALVWLHGQAADSQDEWGLLAKKAYNWLKKQGVDIVNWVAEANKLLNTSVDHKDLQ